jgi:hypothetical protein
MPLPEQGSANLLEAALNYAEQGWPVFPLHSPNGGLHACDEGPACKNAGNQACDCYKGPTCEDPGKHPRTQHGFKDATDDQLSVRRWWKTWPQANIGLAVRPGFVIVDVDGKEGSKALQAANYQLPPTALQTTGRGAHYLYRTHLTIPPRGHILPKVDLRGPGSYVVAAPSLHASGARYGWQIGLEEIEAAPPWLEQFAGKLPSSESRERVNMAALLQGVDEGRRKLELFRAACKLRGADVPYDLALALVQEAAANCRPPLEAAEAERKVAEAYRKYPANITDRDLPADVTLLGPESVMVEYPQARFVFADLEKSGRELSTEMEVTCQLPGKSQEPYIQRINLLSMSTREACRRELDGIFGKEVGWTALLSKAAAKAQDAYLRVDRSVCTSDIAAPPAIQFLVEGLVPEDGLTIFFGAGSSTKTYQLYQMALCVSRGEPFVGRGTRRTRVMVIDYETGQGMYGLRMRRLCEGLGLGPDLSGARDVIYWWAQGIPLEDQIDSIRRCIDAHQIGALFLDHIAAACGGDATEQAVASRFQRTLGKLGLPMVGLAHITGQAANDPQAAYRPFGSIYWENQARRTYFVLRYQEQESALANVGFYPRKINDGARAADFGVNVTFEDPGGPVSINATAINATPHLMKARGPEWQLFEALDGEATVTALSKKTGIGERRVKDLLEGHPKMFVQLDPGGGRNHPAIWARAVITGPRLPYREEDLRF